jgi:pimeloyl-ACP methyl ester carboxylesterase
MSNEDGTFEAPVTGGLLRGSVRGDGVEVLLLHGGPGLEWTYLQPVVDELSDGYRVATYQQRGLAPSTAGPPYDVATQVGDVIAVLDVLGWDHAVVLGHSWGGHLLLHLLANHPDRLSGALVVDPLGGVGDGGVAEFEATMLARTPPKDAQRADELDRQALAGEGTEADAAESLRLLWPAYFADRAAAPPFPGTRMSGEAYAATYESLISELPGLAARLAGVTVPTEFLHGEKSPMPVTASTDSADAIGAAARVQVVEGAGHFVWWERPGCVRAALDRLVSERLPRDS